MIKRPDTKAQRLKRHKRVRSKVSGTPERPRLNVFRSEKNIYAQIIDDVAGNTLVAASSLDKEITGNGGNKVTPLLIRTVVLQWNFFLSHCSKRSEITMARFENFVPTNSLILRMAFANQPHLARL